MESQLKTEQATSLYYLYYTMIQNHNHGMLDKECKNMASRMARLCINEILSDYEDLVINNSKNKPLCEKLIEKVQHWNEVREEIRNVANYGN